jgi:hypothetical protein
VSRTLLLILWLAPSWAFAQSSPESGVPDAPPADTDAELPPASPLEATDPPAAGSPLVVSTSSTPEPRFVGPTSSPLGPAFGVPTSSSAEDQRAQIPHVEGLNQTERVPSDPGLDLGRTALELPAAFFELAFVPVYVTFYALERYRLAERLLDLFTNDARTFGALPIVIPLGRSGPGFGGIVAYNDPLGSPDRFILLGIANVNGDYNTSLEVGRRLPFVRGRALSGRFAASVDRDQQYFGIGSEGNGAPNTLLRRDEIDAEVSITVLPPAVPVLTSEARLAYRRREIGPGEGDESPVFTPQPDGPFAAPPGFGRALDYAEGTIEFGVDTRNSFGLTSRGLLWNNTGRFTHDVNGGRTGGFQGVSELGLYIPLLLRNRTLFLRAGVATALPFRERDDIPLHFLISLGGADRLRGYQEDRFIDELGWWGSLEYRWFFYEYKGTGGGFVSSLFFDVGQVGDDIEDLFDGNLPWSAGISLRVEQSLIMLGRLQLGFSPEGVQVSFAIGDVL